LFASQGETKSRRPTQTLTPLSARLGVAVDTRYAKTDAGRVAAEMRSDAGVSLVAWEHEAIPVIAAGLGSAVPRPPDDWPDGRFDVVWVFVAGGGGWRLSQVPQLLLAGDSASLIA
jgi:hypothetical protein